MKSNRSSGGYSFHRVLCRIHWLLAGMLISSQSWAADQVPHPPTNLTAAAGHTSVTVTLYPPQNDGGSTITSYQVTAAPGGSTCSPPIPTGPTTSCTVTGLTSGTYSFTATATNSVGTSEPSASVSAKVEITAPGAPTNAVSTPGNGAVEMTFTTPTDDGGAPITAYTVKATPSGNTCNAPLVSLSVKTGCVITGLSNGTEYTLVASATNSIGTTDGNPHKSTPSASIPPAPSGVSAIASNASATISWNAVNWSDNAHIDNYTVTANPGGKTCTANALTSSSQPPSSCSIDGLINGKAYTFTVVTTAGSASSSASSIPSASSNTVTPSANVPASPSNVTATAGNGTVSVTWDAPTPQPTGYQVHAWSVSPTAGGGFTAPIDTGIACTPIPATDTKCTFAVGQLSVGLWYEFTVQAQNEHGYSLPSAFSGAAQPTGSVTFNFADSTGLPADSYQIYVTGFSTAGPFMLTADGQGNGSFGNVPSDVGTLSCYKYPQEIKNITIDSSQTQLSGRVYYFIVSNTKDYSTACNPVEGQTGLFGQSDAFTYSKSGANVKTPDPSLVLSGAMPAWTFSEIGTSSTNATIDLSQVDFFSFPMNTVAQVTSGPGKIGNPVGPTDNPEAVVNANSVYGGYQTYFNNLAKKANNNKTCSEDSTPIACAFLDLLQSITNSPGTPYIIQNPGGYLGIVNSEGDQEHAGSSLNSLFDSVIQDIWDGTYGPLKLDSGGYLGGSGTDAATNGIAEDVFVSSATTMNYPGSSYSVKALKFVGSNTSYVVYVFDPTDVAAGCKSGKITTSICGDAFSGGYQVFAGAGVLKTPSCDEYNALVDAGSISGTSVPDCATLTPSTPSPVGLANYQAVAGRLGFLISTALNRGVGEVHCTKETWKCWQDETNWYPTDSTSQYTSKANVQNLFSRWIHTAAISGTPIFVQPPSAVQSAGGKPMGMAYGFSNDENPTPPVDPSQPQPEVPSKFDSTVLFGVTTNTITFAPWVTSSLSPQLTVNLKGQGTVSSSPSGIDCGTTCMAPFNQGDVVQLTASPSQGFVFSGWTGGGCSSSSTTCSVTMSSSKTILATFVAHAPDQLGLNVTVTGPGTVSGGGINCQPTCSVAEPSDSQIKLTAIPAAGSTFTGWSGACSGASPNCQVTMSQAQSVHANFKKSTEYTLTVTSPGVGGTVTTLPAGIDCGSVCQASFETGTEVKAMAQPSAGFVFTGWSGACTGTQTCVLSMTSDRTLTAEFASTPPQTYSLTVHDTGSGTVISDPAGINCGNTCSYAFAADSRVSLTATPAQGYRFSTWGGACSGSGACVVDMETAESATANFISTIPTTFTVSGSIGMSGTTGNVTLTLTPASTNTGTPSQTLSQTVPAGPFSFAGLNQGEYTLSIVGLSKQKLLCTFVANQSLTAPPITIKDSNSTGNAVNCQSATKGYSVGGVVTGLDPGKAVTLRNNGGTSGGGSTLSISNPGPQQFLFANQVANTSGYLVTIKTQPPGQNCVVTQNGKGSASSHANSLAVNVVCQKKPADFSVGGTVAGLPAGQTVALLDNESDRLSVKGAGDGQQGVPFTFGAEIGNGKAYLVSIQTQPAGYNCSIQNKSGIVNGGDVTNVAVTCVDNPSTYNISGTAYGLNADQTVVVKDGTSLPQKLTSASNQYAFSLASNSAYSLSNTSSSTDCSFDGPDPTSGTITRNLVVNLVCKTPPVKSTLSVQNSVPHPQPAFLLNRNQAAVLQVNGEQTVTVWGGATEPTIIGTFTNGFGYNVHAIGQSQHEECDQFDDANDPGVLVGNTTLMFMCTNVGPGATPGVCAGSYNNSNQKTMPPEALGDLCGGSDSSTSGVTQLTDGRWQWRCSGSGNPKVISTPAGPQWQGTSTCYTASYSKSETKQNQAPLWISPTSWTIRAGSSQNFTVQGGSGTGDLYAPGVESVGHAICSIQTRVKNPGYSIHASKAPNTNGNGACVVWAKKMGDGTYYDVEASPTVFNVTAQ